MSQEPQTFDELEKEWLDAHHEEYKHLIRQVLGYSIGALTFLVSFYQQYAAKTQNYRWMALAALVGLLLSAVCGLLIQYCLMYNYIRRLTAAKATLEEAEARGDQTAIKLRQRPSTMERVCFRLQLILFALSFVLLVSYTALNML